jgi:hypothetical protein
LLAFSWSLLAHNLLKASRLGTQRWHDEALSLADQALGYLKGKECLNEITYNSLIVKGNAFLYKGDWISLLETGRKLCEFAIMSQNHYEISSSCLWIVMALERSGRFGECVIEAQNSLNIFNAMGIRQIEREREIHKLLLAALVQLKRWDDIWLHAQNVLTSTQDPDRSDIRFVVLSAAIPNARNDSDRRMAIRSIEESGGWIETLLRRPHDQLRNEVAGLYLSMITRLQDWVRVGPSISSEGWEEIDQAYYPSFFISETIAELCKSRGRAVAFSALSDLLTNGLPSTLKSASNHQSQSDTDVQLPAVAFLERCLSSFISQIDDADFLIDVVKTVEDHFPDRFEGQRKILTAAADFHRSGCDPATLARMNPDIAQTLRMIWLPDSEGDQPPPPPKRTAARKASAKKRRKP